jgi:hypothetical protein
MHFLVRSRTAEPSVPPDRVPLPVNSLLTITFVNRLLRTTKNTGLPLPTTIRWLKARQVDKKIEGMLDGRFFGVIDGGRSFASAIDLVPYHS